jgi:anti-anti-sigma factor
VAILTASGEDVGMAGTDSGPADASPEEAGGGDVAVLTEGRYTLVIMHGDIDVRVSDDLEHAGRFSIDAGRTTLMDVRNVTMMDSVGLSFVVRLAAGLRTTGAQLLLRGPCPRVAELLTLVGADGLVTWVHETTTGETAIAEPATRTDPAQEGAS